MSIAATKARWGTGTGLVLLHGWGMNAAVWEGLPGPLMEAATLIELPGHGSCGLPERATDLAAWADACLAAAPERAVWLGWSLGGLVALAAALRAPQRVAGLILMTATPRFVQAPDWPAAMAWATLNQFHDGLLADPAGTLDRFLALQVRGSAAARETLRTLRRELAARPAPDPRALALGLDLLRDCDLRGRLGELTCPSLWLFGSHDTLVPAAVAPAVGALLPEARVEVIRGAAHAPFLSHPEETRALIKGFLVGLADTPTAPSAP
ncbi:MAG TPA: pimeloyl-ACP methyl ester esterase BioH [Chromatiaceae bacterium]|nr:pimeloyl-ACP methyl ester esterase BioH [Chromatiaceae bacterium]